MTLAFKKTIEQAGHNFSSAPKAQAAQNDFIVDAAQLSMAKISARDENNNDTPLFAADENDFGSAMGFVPPEAPKKSFFTPYPFARHPFAARSKRTVYATTLPLLASHQIEPFTKFSRLHNSAILPKRAATILPAATYEDNSFIQAAAHPDQQALDNFYTAKLGIDLARLKTDGVVENNFSDLQAVKLERNLSATATTALAAVSLVALGCAVAAPALIFATAPAACVSLFLTGFAAFDTAQKADETKEVLREARLGNHGYAGDIADTRDTALISSLNASHLKHTPEFAQVFVKNLITIIGNNFDKIFNTETEEVLAAKRAKQSLRRAPKELAA